jgi:hypothetical protein
MWLEERPTKAPRWSVLTIEEEDALYAENCERQRRFFREQRQKKGEAR